MFVCPANYFHREMCGVCGGSSYLVDCCLVLLVQQQYHERAFNNVVHLGVWCVLLLMLNIELFWSFWNCFENRRENAFVMFLLLFIKQKTKIFIRKTSKQDIHTQQPYKIKKKNNFELFMMKSWRLVNLKYSKWYSFVRWSVWMIMRMHNYLAAMRKAT